VFTPEEDSNTIRAVLPAKIYATIVKIVLVATPESPEKFTVDDVKVFACFEEEVTTTTTTPVETTTQKTTTSYTPTATTVTTVQTTIRPSTPQISKFTALFHLGLKFYTCNLCMNPASQ
jgi:hypothetical protein